MEPDERDVSSRMKKRREKGVEGLFRGSMRSAALEEETARKKNEGVKPGLTGGFFFVDLQKPPPPSTRAFAALPLQTASRGRLFRAL